mgnify:CR=1 FL=1
MNNRELQDKAHAMALGKGWWEGEGLSPNSLGAKLAMVHSEVSEAVACVRDGELGLYWTWGGIIDRDPDTRHPTAKPEGLPIELADIVLRVADLAGRLGIDLQDAIAQKMAYNKTRPHRHGGKRL